MNKTLISIFKNLKETRIPHYVSIEQSLNRIKNGKSKELVEKIRRETDHNKKNKLKSELPSILFAGEFTQRAKKGLKEHKGFMVTDFDKYNSKEDLSKSLKELKENKHFVALFISPSGDGIKGVVKIRVCDAVEHEKIFKKFQEDFKYDNFDIANCNVDRVCYESYDPDIYINWEAEEYSPIIEDKGFTISERKQLIPITDEEKIINKIANWSWNMSFSEGQRNSFVLALSQAFCEYGINETTAYNYFNTVYGTSKDFTDTELRNTISNAYSRVGFNIKFFEDWKKIKSIQLDRKLTNDALSEKYPNVKKEILEEIKESVEVDDFWYEVMERNVPKIKIDNIKYKFFLENSGFKKYFPNGSQKPVFVRVNSNKVEETSIEKIKDHVLNYLLERNEISAWNRCVNYGNIFSENYLLMLDTIELIILRDSKEKCLIAFNNGVLEITKDHIELKEYLDFEKYIWKEQIINHDFEYSKNKDNDYKDFIRKISNNNNESFESVIGYLIHTYKNKMNNKAIILNDEVISENPEGGTGKGLFVQGVKQVRKTAILDGKSFDDKKSFPYQTVSQDVNILVFDDVKKNFDFESKFSLVTEGMTLERKNKDAIKLTVEESPKLVISTNYAIKGEGNSHNRRRHEIEVSQFYNGELTPYDDFGRQLFDDWDSNDYNNFYNYMVGCVQYYLKNGLISQDAKNIKLRKLIAETSFDFIEWVKDPENMQLNNRNDKKDYFDNFVNEYQDYKKWLTRKKFMIWLQKYAKYIDAKYIDGNTNGIRWFEIETNEEDIIETPF
jgi:hypothetical protein